ncbi:hypothetical protein HDV00_008556 [Rhizophlyctis rosea]|nr:hypothetical protein HDV00_008556 [Rhizophlyctis rosea]
MSALFSALPDEILTQIFAIADGKAVGACLCTSKKFARVIAQNDSLVWKAKVSELTTNQKPPVLLKDETYMEVYRQHIIWNRDFDLARTKREVVLTPVDSLPPLADDIGHISTRRQVISAFKAPAPNSGADCISADKACVIDDRQVLFERKGHIYRLRFSGHEVGTLPMQGENKETITLIPLKLSGDESVRDLKIRIPVRSRYVGVSNDDMSTEFYSLDSGKHLGSLEGGEEEAALCGKVYASAVFDREARSAVLQIWSLDIDESTDRSTPSVQNPSSTDPSRSEPEHRSSTAAERTQTPYTVPSLITEITEVDDSLRGFALNENVLAYRTYNADSLHPIEFRSLPDVTRIGSIVLDDVAQDMYLHLRMTRFHLAVVCGVSRKVLIYELKSLSRIHILPLDVLGFDIGDIQWVEVAEYECCIVIAVAGARLLVINLKEKASVLYMLEHGAEGGAVGKGKGPEVDGKDGVFVNGSSKGEESNSQPTILWLIHKDLRVGADGIRWSYSYGVTCRRIAEEGISET